VFVFDLFSRFSHCRKRKIEVCLENTFTYSRMPTSEVVPTRCFLPTLSVNVESSPMDLSSSVNRSDFSCTDWGFDFGLELNFTYVSGAGVGYVTGGLDHSSNPNSLFTCKCDSHGTLSFGCDSFESTKCSVGCLLTSKDIATAVKGQSFRALKVKPGSHRSDVSPEHGEAIEQIEFCFQC